MSTVLLTGGRAPVALEFARIFNAAGHRVLMAESAPAHLAEPSSAIERNFRVPPPRQQTAAYIDALQQIIIDQRVDLLLPTCEEIFYVAIGRDKLSPHCVVFAEPIEKLRPLHHKWKFVSLARQYGLSVPETILIESPSELPGAFDRWQSLVFKPAYSRFASHTILNPRKDDRISNLDMIPDHPWLAQEFIVGHPICTYSVVHQGKIVAHTAYRSEYTAGQGATIVFQHSDHAGCLNWVKRFVAAEHFTGQIAFDFIETSAGDVVALECNPRATSGVHLFADTRHFSQAFFEPLSDCLTPRSNQSSMLATAMLIYGLPFALFNQRLGQWASTLLHSRDVIFTLADPLPALLQWRSIAYFVALGYRHGISPLEASTFDIEWNGQP